MIAAALEAEATTKATISRDLHARIGEVTRGARHLSINELSRRVNAIRHIAIAGSLVPLARLAGGLADALGGEGRGVSIATWTGAMGEALAHDAQDEATARIFLASVGARLAG